MRLLVSNKNRVTQKLSPTLEGVFALRQDGVDSHTTSYESLSFVVRKGHAESLCHICDFKNTTAQFVVQSASRIVHKAGKNAMDIGTKKLIGISIAAAIGAILPTAMYLLDAPPVATVLVTVGIVVFAIVACLIVWFRGIEDRFRRTLSWALFSLTWLIVAKLTFGWSGRAGVAAETEWKQSRFVGFLELMTQQSQITDVVLGIIAVSCVIYACKLALSPHAGKHSERSQADDVMSGTQDTLRSWVRHVLSVKYPKAEVTHCTLGKPGLSYYRIATTMHGFPHVFPVGVCELEITEDTLSNFVASVKKYQMGNAAFPLEVVYSGERPDNNTQTLAERHRISLRSFPQFQGLIDFSDYLTDQTNRLNQDQIYPPSLYIDQRMAFDERGQRTQTEDALDVLQSWLQLPTGRFVVILGSFGTGKTFLLHELARRMHEKGDGIIPILIEMRNLEKGRTLDQLVAQHFATFGEDAYNRKAFRYMLEHGRIVLLFDGFDELALRVSYERVVEHFDTLLEAAIGDAKVIVTSRTQHFVSDQQVRTAIGKRAEELPSNRIAYLQPFDEIQISHFLLKRYEGDRSKADRRLKLIQNIQDLMGLSATPRMLVFIADLPEERLMAVQDASGEISAADLYQEILSTWMENEWSRRHPKAAIHGLPLEQMWFAVTDLAIRLWAKTDHAVPLEELEESVQSTLDQNLTGNIPTDLQVSVHQVGSGTLLCRDVDGDFHFVHQSVMEWLVARSIAQEVIHQSSETLLLSRRISPLMASFLRDLIGHDKLQEWFDSLLEKQDVPDVLIENMRLISSHLANADRPLNQARLEGRILQGQDFSNEKLAGRELSCGDFFSSLFVGTDLSNAVMVNARLVQCNFRSANMSGADLREAVFDRANLDGADMRGADVEGASFRLANLLHIKDRNIEWSKADLFGAALRPQNTTFQLHARSSAVHCVAFMPVSARRPIPADREPWDEELWPPTIFAVGTTSGASVCDAFNGHELFHLIGHRGAVYRVAFSADGKSLASAGQDGTARLWNVETGQEISSFEGHESAVSGVAFSPDGRLLATSSEDETVRLWEIETGVELRQIHCRQGKTMDVAFSCKEDMFATAGQDGSICMWKTETGEELGRLKRHNSVVSRIAFAPGTGNLASVSHDGTAQIWDIHRSISHRSLEGQMGILHDVAFSPDGSSFATVGQSEGVNVWKTDNLSIVCQLEGHRGAVFGVAFSPDGVLLATAGIDKTTRLWKLASRREVDRLEGHSSVQLSVKFSPDGSRLVSSGNSGRVDMWDVGSGRQVLSSSVNQNIVICSTFSPDGKLTVSTGDDGLVELRDADTGVVLRGMQFGKSRIYGAAISPDGKLLAVAGENGLVQLFVLETLHTIRHFKGHKATVLRVTFSPDGAVLATTSQNGTVRLWDVNNGQEIHGWKGHEGAVYGVDFSADGHTLATGGDDGIVRLWRTDDVCELSSFTGHIGTVSGVAFSPIDGTIATSGHDGTIRFWDLDKGREVHQHIGHHDAILSLDYSPDGELLATASVDGTIRLWETSASYEPQQIAAHDSAVNQVEFSREWRTLISISGDGSAKVWALNGGNLVHQFNGHDGAINEMALSPDGKTLATVGVDATTRLWEIASGHQIHVWNGRSGAVHSVAFSSDGRLLATGADDGTVSVYEVEVDQISRIPTVDGRIRSIAFTPSGGSLVVAGADGTIRVCDLARGSVVRRFAGHSANSLWKVSISPDGRSIATCGTDGTARIWDIETGRLLNLLEGHQKAVLSVAFSPDGRTLATAGEDEVVKLWDIESGSDFREFHGHEGPVLSVSFSPDGRSLVTGGRDGTVRLWSVSALHWILIPTEDSWASIRSDGAHFWQGGPGAPFWYVNGLVRFEADEMPSLRLHNENDNNLLPSNRRKQLASRS